MVPYRTITGRRVREDDEQHHLDDWAKQETLAHEMIARYTGRCITTGQRINPGDVIVHKRGVGSTLVRRGTSAPADEGRYISDVIRIGGKEFYRNKRGTCEDAPCCGCCTI